MPEKIIKVCVVANTKEDAGVKRNFFNKDLPGTVSKLLEDEDREGRPTTVFEKIKHSYAPPSIPFGIYATLQYSYNENDYTLNFYDVASQDCQHDDCTKIFQNCHIVIVCVKSRSNFNANKFRYNEYVKGTKLITWTENENCENKLVKLLELASKS